MTERRPRSTRFSGMTLGDVLQRLALIAPDQYRAIDLMIREVYAREWPIEEDVLLLTHDLEQPVTHN